MDMVNNTPGWLTPIAWVFIALALLTAVAIAYDIYARDHRHDAVAVEVMWITSALYLGPFALLPYRSHGRGARRDDQPTAVASRPGGGASAVGHLIGVPLVLASGLTIAGINLWVMILVIGVLAIALLFVFERFASSAPGRISVGTAFVAATLTVLAFDLGMGGWMLLLHFNEFMPPATEGSFWFLMQIGIVLGIVTGYPVVKWLAARNQTVVPA